MASNTTDVSLVCRVCQQTFPRSELVRGDLLRPSIVAEIRKEHPGWEAAGYICKDDLGRYRNRHVERLLQAEKGELDSVEREVLESLRASETVASNINEEFESVATLGERLADRVAGFGGSWRFIILFLAVLLGWISLNSIALLSRPFDPFPFILLNLVLSCIAAIQAPVILMSQNREEQKDRLRAEHDYRVNLKAELEIRQLHEKIDHLQSHQWERLIEIQRVQIELMNELTRKE
ncbi:MAG: DUF1003 domain-containing protein [Planctomycetota bacterium]